jgi:hypothetical protein
MLAAWALSPARQTPIHPRRERRGFPAFFGEKDHSKAVRRITETAVLFVVVA